MEIIILVLVYYSIGCILHEAGHYLTARKVGIIPTLFKIGMGPTIYQRGIIQIAAFPVTGRVTYTDDDFYSLSVFKQKAIVAAGPLVNIITGAILLPVFPLFGILGVTIGFSNLIPAKTSAGISDGGFLFAGKSKWPAIILLSIVVIFLVFEILKLV